MRATRGRYRRCELTTAHRIATAIGAAAALSVLAAAAALPLALVETAAAADYGTGAPMPFPVFPADNPWNTLVDTLPLDPNSAAYIAHMDPSTGLHPDFGTVWDGAPNGIPYVVVPGDQPRVPIDLRLRRRERSRALSDPGRRAHRGRPRRHAATATC